MILILTAPGDRTADHVEQKLRQRGREVAQFDTASFPSAADLSVAYSPQGRFRAVIHSASTAIDLDRVTAVWLRQTQPSVPHGAIVNGKCRDAVAQECRAVLNDAWHAADCRWLPAPPSVVRDAQHKLGQLTLAGEVGFELPPTLITNNPDDLLAFYRKHNGAIISKLADLGFHQHLGGEFARYTEVVSRRDIGYLDTVRYCPMIYQAYIPKQVELRVTVVGPEVFAAEIRSQASKRTRHDWRRYDDLLTPYARHELPPDVRRYCLQLTERLGLCYGAIDLVLTPDGRYVFLEINPAGQYLWIENATGLPISDAICDVLIAGPSPLAPAPAATNIHFGGVR
ncbi:MAG: hypothetical protein M3457_06800 [Chloroflexota bacterium]|nr:hypothetical protein [Chloroflexota bacterium]